MHSSPSSDLSPSATGNATVDRDKELYRGVYYTPVCIPGTTNTATGGGRPGTRRVSQSQYLGQGQKVPRSPDLPRH
ncbi:unnamed protein product [Lasius platythorax]|uniref:Uncharacterized protein n=1 Tax=Lasius platythorax TaxID=488582 RepID=A0AAV2N126_9HYME